MIKEGSNVTLNYTGKLENGSVFDSSEGRDPLKFTVGSGNVIPGFEQGIIGLNVGEKKSITIPPNLAYGEYRDELKSVVPKSNAPENVEVGSTLQANVNGKMVTFIVREVNESDIVVDANHPLSGQTLIFDIEVVEVSEFV